MATELSENTDNEDRLTTLSNPWSTWGVRLIALLGVATAISFGYAWVQQFYRGEPVNSIISFPAFDYPWMPVHTTQIPIIGNHYFGDFQLPYGWALNVRDSFSPYLGSAVPANYSPLAILFVVPFTIFPVKIATMLFLLLSAIVFMLPLWLLLSPLSISLRCVMLVPIALMTEPFISMLDRGNNIGIGFGLVTWAIVAWRSERWFCCGAFLAAAIALKVYPVTLLIVPLAFRRYRFSALVITSVIGLNLAALAFIPGGFVRNLRAVIPAMTSQRLTTGVTQFASWGIYSLLPKLVALLFGTTQVTAFLNPNRLLLWLPSVLYLVCIFFIIKRHRVAQWCWGPLSLASIQLVVPLSGAYTTGWACIAAIWFACGWLVPEEAIVGYRPLSTHAKDRVLRILMMLAIATSLVPSTFAIVGVGGFSILATRFLSPAFLFFALCLALMKSFGPGVGQSQSGITFGSDLDVRPN